MSHVQAVAETITELALDPLAERQDVLDALDPVASEMPFSWESVAQLTLVAASRDPRFERTSPVDAAEALLRMLILLAPIRHVALWVATPLSAPRAVVHLGGRRPTAAMREVARRTLARSGGPVPASPVHGVELLADDEVVGALTVRPFPGQADSAAAFVSPLIEPLVSILTRARAVEVAPGRQRAAVAAALRRVRRVGLDLHDGPLQSAALLLGEIALFRSQLAGDAAPGLALVGGRLDDLHARVAALQDEMRQIALACTEDPPAERPVEARLVDLVAAFERRSSIVASLELSGDFRDLSMSQELALFHIVQEALSNVREHSKAQFVRVAASAADGAVHATVVDDGDGFDVEQVTAAGRSNKRLGVMGMLERARLLGGSVKVESVAGGPTTVTIDLPAWRAPGRSPRLRAV